MIERFIISDNNIIEKLKFGDNIIENSKFQTTVL